MNDRFSLSGNERSIHPILASDDDDDDDDDNRRKEENNIEDIS